VKNVILQHTGIGIDRLKLSGLSLKTDQFLSALNLFGFRLFGCLAVPGEKGSGCSEVWAGFSGQKLSLYDLTGSYSLTKDGLQIFGVSFKRHGQQIARFQLCRTPAHTCVATYEVHPPHLSQGELNTFDVYIVSILGENYSYRSFAKHGKVSKIEIYTDLLNIPPDSFILHRPGARRSCMFQGHDAITVDPSAVNYSDPEDADLIELIELHNITTPTTIPRAPGHRTTQYSCGRESLFQAKSYCSKTRLIDTNRPNFYSHHPHRTRLEITLRKTGKQLSQLADLENQFEKIQVYDLAQAAALKDRKFTWFMKSAQKQGIALALKAQGSNQKKEIRRRLASCQADWYSKIVNFWGNLPKCLEVLEPDYLLEWPKLPMHPLAPADTSTDTLGKPSEDTPTKTIPKFVQDVLDAVANQAQGITPPAPADISIAPIGEPTETIPDFDAKDLLEMFTKFAQEGK